MHGDNGITGYGEAIPLAPTCLPMLAEGRRGGIARLARAKRATTDGEGRRRACIESVVAPGSIQARESVFRVQLLRRGALHEGNEMLAPLSAAGDQADMVACGGVAGGGLS